MSRIGIFGGSFNPPHNGHIIACNAFHQILKLDKLFIVPAGIAPHKQENDITISNTDRFNMAKLAFPEYEISDFEIKSDDISYSATTATHFKKKFSSDDIFLYISSDMVYTLQTWYKPHVIAESCKIVCATRYKNEIAKLSNHCKLLKEQYGFEIEIIEFEPCIISSTILREKIAKKEDVSDLIPKKVLDYIIAKELYCER